MDSGYTIDANDLLDTYGIVVKKIKGLLGLRSRKGEILYSWLDENGEEAFTDSNDIYFEGRNIFMFCIIKNATFSTLETNFAAFKAVLEASGMRTLVTPYSGSSFTLMYVKGNDLDIITPPIRSNYYVGEFWVQFRQTTPV